MADVNQEEKIFRKRWYDNSNIIKLITSQMWGQFNGTPAFREMVFLDKGNVGKDRTFTVRLMLSNRPELFRKHAERFRLYEKTYTIYHSLMYFDRLPFTSYNLKKRYGEYNKWFGDKNEGYINPEYPRHRKFYELTLDFDSKDPKFRDARRQVCQLMKLFDDWETPYMVKFSGTHGFHVTVPVRWFIDSMQGWNPKTAPEFYTVLAESLKKNHSMDCLDTGIYDDLRLMKTAYTIAGDNVVLPLKRDEVKDFDIDLVKAENYINDTGSLYNRGFCMNNKEGNIMTAVSELWYDEDEVEDGQSD